ncbi:MAG: SPOR domain-containing protein, partial [Bacteroidales bacterium]|nr:SPOR domain-containing protein [Bacteroidales bacterium]
PVTKPVTPDRIPDADTSTSGGYRLQFLVLSSPLEADSRYFERLTRKLPNLNISVRKEEDGLYHYVSRVFRTRSEARHWMRMINGMGWQDCVLRAETEKPLKN